MSNHPLHHRPAAAVAALAFAATVTLSLLSALSMLAERYHADALVVQAAVTVAQPASASVSGRPRA